MQPWSIIQSHFDRYDSNFFRNAYEQYRLVPDKAAQIYERYQQSLKFEQGMNAFWTTQLQPKLVALNTMFSAEKYRQFQSMAKQFLTLASNDTVLQPLVLETQRALKRFDMLYPTVVYDPPLMV